MSSSHSSKFPSPKNPPVVTLVSQLVGAQRPLPRHGGYVNAGELQSLHARLHNIIVQAANLADTVNSIRDRVEMEDETAKGESTTF